MNQIPHTDQIIFTNLTMKKAFRIWCKAHCVKIRKPLTNVAVWFKRDMRRNCEWKYYEKRYDNGRLHERKWTCEQYKNSPKIFSTLNLGRYSITFSLKYILNLKSPFMQNDTPNEMISLLLLMDYKRYIMSNGKRLYTDVDKLYIGNIVYILSDDDSIDLYQIRNVDIPYIDVEPRTNMSFVFGVVESSTSNYITLESDIITLYLEFIASTKHHESIFSAILENILEALYSELDSKYDMKCNIPTNNIYY